MPPWQDPLRLTRDAASKFRRAPVGLLLVFTVLSLVYPGEVWNIDDQYEEELYSVNLDAIDAGSNDLESTASHSVIISFPVGRAATVSDRQSNARPRPAASLRHLLLRQPRGMTAPPAPPGNAIAVLSVWP